MKLSTIIILALNIVFIIGWYTLYEIFDINKYFLIWIAAFSLILLPLDSFILSRKIYPTTHKVRPYIIHIIVYLSFLSLFNYFVYKTSWYGMIYSLEQYATIERLLLQYPFLWIIGGLVYIIGLDILLRYILQKFHKQLIKKQ
jgi:hypothetical protein